MSVWKMRTITFIIGCALWVNFYLPSTQAQQDNTVPTQFEKGAVSEVKDKSRIFINADSARRSENIAKELSKYQSIQVVRDLADADYVVAYRVERDKEGTTVGPAGWTLQDNWIYYGRMLVYSPQRDKPARLLWEARLRYQEPPPRNPSASPAGRKNWEQPLEKSAAGKFIKALKKARGEK
jgi:hypothetical protein